MQYVVRKIDQSIQLNFRKPVILVGELIDHHDNLMRLKYETQTVTCMILPSALTYVHLQLHHIYSCSAYVKFNIITYQIEIHVFQIVELLQNIFEYEYVKLHSRIQRGLYAKHLWRMQRIQPPLYVRRIAWVGSKSIPNSMNAEWHLYDTDLCIHENYDLIVYDVHQSISWSNDRMYRILIGDASHVPHWRLLVQAHMQVSELNTFITRQHELCRATCIHMIHQLQTTLYAQCEQYVQHALQCERMLSAMNVAFRRLPLYNVVMGNLMSLLEKPMLRMQYFMNNLSYHIPDGTDHTTIHERPI